MIIGIIILAIISFCLYGLFAGRRAENDNSINKIKSDNLEEDNEDGKYNEIEEKFFYEVSSGKARYKFLKIDNQFDLMFIKSIFQSENIPYYVEFETISKIRPGIYLGDLGNYTLLYILDEDYDDAIKIIKNYLETKRTSKEDDKLENARNFFEVLFGNWKVPSARDTNGIEVIYKKNT
jgi:hypothetical protein